MRSVGAPSMVQGLVSLRARGVVVRNVIDGGACLGDWTELLKVVFPEARVLMIEAQERHRPALLATCRRFSPSVTLASSLVGAQAGATVAFTVLDNPGAGTGSSVMPENSDVPRHVVELPVTTIDTLVEASGLPAPDFVKLDLQGYELEALKGASKALSTADHVLLEVSFWQYNEGSPLIHDVLAWMNAAGFVAYDIFDISRRRDGVLLQADLLFVRHDSVLLRDRTTFYGVGLPA